MEQAITTLTVLLFISLGIAVWAIVVSRKTAAITKNLPDLRELQRLAASMTDAERKMEQLIDNRVDRLFATAMGSPILLSGVSLSAIPGVMEKIGERIGDILDDPPDEFREQTEKLVTSRFKELISSPEIQERIKQKLVDYLDSSEDIINSVLDPDSDAYGEFLDTIQKWIPVWMAEELANPESKFRKELAETLAERLTEIINGN